MFNDFLSLFDAPADPSLLVYGVYDTRLVLLSLAVAVFASWMALNMAGQARQAPNRLLRYTALISGSLALGVGVWAMHFVGMLAFSLCTPVTFDPARTFWSVLPSLAASYVALVLLARPRVSCLRLMVGAVLVGLGIGSMHYAGMTAMRMLPSLHYEPKMFALSVVVAVLLAALALWVRFGLRAARGLLPDWLRVLLAALVMGGAIAGMHYIGMAAARFAGPTLPGAGGTANADFVALAVCLLTTALALASACLNGWLRYREVFRRAHGNELRQRALLAASVDGVITLNAQGEVEDFNSAAERMFGYARTEVLGRKLDSLLVPTEEAPPLRDANDLSDVLISEQVGIVSRVSEMWALKRDGERLPVRASFSFRQQVEGDLFIVFVSDISAQKAMSRALEEREAQLRSVVSSIPGIAFRAKLAEGWPVLYMSDVMETMTGFPAAEFVGPDATRDLFGMIEPEDRERTMGAMAAAVADGKPHLVEFRMRRRDGELRWMWGNGRVSFDAQGRAKYLDGVILDVTERMDAQLAVEHFKAMVDSSADAIFSITAESVITSWNKGAEKTFGYTAGEALGKRSIDLLASPALPFEPGTLLKRAIGGERIEQFETQRRRKDGSLLDISATISPIQAPDGRVVGASMIARDTTERRRMESDLRAAKEVAEKAAEARSAFLANMSHEIRTPMNAVLGFTEVLLQGELKPAQRRHLDTIRASGRSLLRLLNEVLDVAKLDRGAMELETADFNLLSLIDGLTSTLGYQARAKGLDIVVQYEQGLDPSFHGDEMRLRQILINLLGNAVKFTSEGSVTLGVTRDQGLLHFTVRDTGIGIAPERLSAIFDPFTQADASMTRRYGGTGLGTTIAKQLTELMHGRIWAESKLGLGSCFHVLVPLPPARRPAAPVAAGEALPPQLPPLRMLAVDDVPQNLELIKLLLEELGHQVDCVSDGAQAVTRALRDHYDVVLMDVHMPGLDGLAATHMIRAEELKRGRARMPVVALTASVQETDHTAALEAGMDGFAAKPVEVPALLREVARVLKIDANTPIAAKALGAQVAQATRAPRVEEALLRGPGANKAFNGPSLEIAIQDAAARDLAMRGHAGTAHGSLPALTGQDPATAPAGAPVPGGAQAHGGSPAESTSLVIKPRSALGNTDRREALDGALATAQGRAASALDYSGGLRRFGGKAAPYHRMLARFATQYAGTAQEIIAQVGAGHLGGAREAAHRLRGLAANLGLVELQRLGGALEEALVGGRDHAQVEAIAAHLPAALATALDAIASVVTGDEPLTQEAAPYKQPTSLEATMSASLITNTQANAQPNPATTAHATSPSTSVAPASAPAAIAANALYTLARNADAHTHPLMRGARRLPPQARGHSSDAPDDNIRANPSAARPIGSTRTHHPAQPAATQKPLSTAPSVPAQTRVPTLQMKVIAGTPARPDGQAPLAPALLGEVQTLATGLARGFERGAIDDNALARVLELLQGRVAPATRAGLQRAVDDFDFALARKRLTSLLAESGATGQDPAAGE